ncbi:hypothetical protein LCER1_G006887 [Lachnellula cervina]|uniref:Rrn9 domain-containing protein n=1 Tax=Lachnellula cervina TaxID=1316786 RepID=A0A7D8UM98_9HELO|nr:hypothetical protein LCER1_G006887 [Lachnellula cervina]
MSDHSNSSDPEESELSRLNRWTGAPSTWQGIAAQERELAASLDALRDRDLGVHLYNAHALKKRAVSGVRQEDEDAAEPFVPPKSWTAWPLPSDDVPREEEPITGEDPNEAYTFRRSEKERASGVLEDVLLGISLKSAKKKFEAREWASEDEKDVEDEDGNEDGLVAPPEEEHGGENGEPFIKEQTPEKPLLHPVVSADDERSREILQPTIRHTISRLDDVLMALHHARKTCRRYSSVSAPNTGDEEESSDEEDEEGSAKRSKGRPKKFENLTHRSRPEEVEQDVNMSAEILRAKKPGRGRKPKQYPRHAGETDQQYLVRIARLQKKPIPIFSSEETVTPPIVAKPPKKAPVPKIPAARKSPARSPPPHKDQILPKEADKRSQRNLALRDWSEVLGSAALVGFPPDVIARATQRCANIFGESMTMRTMIEAPFGDENPDTLTTYQPEAIPDFESSLPESDSDNSEESEQEHRFVKQAKPLGNAPNKEVCYCPIKDCPRQVRGFSSLQDMRAHLRRGHKMSKEDIAEFEVPSDEEMDGAVHVDGFLRMEKRTLRGRDRGKRKRRRGQSETGNREDEDKRSLSEESGSDKAIDGQAIVRENGGDTGSDDEDS